MAEWTWSLINTQWYQSRTLREKEEIKVIQRFMSSLDTKKLLQGGPTFCLSVKIKQHSLHSWVMHSKMTTICWLVWWWAADHAVQRQLLCILGRSRECGITQYGEFAIKPREGIYHAHHINTMMHDAKIVIMSTNTGVIVLGCFIANQIGSELYISCGTVQKLSIINITQLACCFTGTWSMPGLAWNTCRHLLRYSQFLCR